MKKTLALVLCLVAVLCLCCACGDSAADPNAPVDQSDPAESRDKNSNYTGPEVVSNAMLMVDDTLFVESNYTIDDYLGDPNTMDTISSSVELEETPSENGQSNFECLGAPYTPYGEGVAVFLDDTWIYFVPAEAE